MNSILDSKLNDDKLNNDKSLKVNKNGKCDLIMEIIGKLSSKIEKWVGLCVQLLNLIIILYLSVTLADENSTAESNINTSNSIINKMEQISEQINNTLTIQTNNLNSLQYCSDKINNGLVITLEAINNPSYWLNFTNMILGSTITNLQSKTLDLSNSLTIANSNIATLNDKINSLTTTVNSLQTTTTSKTSCFSLSHEIHDWDCIETFRTTELSELLNITTINGYLIVSHLHILENKYAINYKIRESFYDQIITNITKVFENGRHNFFCVKQFTHINNIKVNTNDNDSMLKWWFLNE
jgi:hypothetical protein